MLDDDWAEAVLIMDADVIFTPSSLAKMTRHLSDPKVGAVSAYIAEGSRDRNYMTRFIAIEYVLAQLASRRAQNVLGAHACLAGGAQLHSRANLEAIGGAIPTGTLAEDTVATFESQLHGRADDVRAARRRAGRGAAAPSTPCGSSACAGPAATCRSRRSTARSGSGPATACTTSAASPSAPPGSASSCCRSR